MGAFSFRATVAALEHALPEDPLDRLERLILDHKPTTATEAVSILELVMSEMACGPRCDGRDIRAVCNVVAWLRDIDN